MQRGPGTSNITIFWEVFHMWALYNKEPRYKEVGYMYNKTLL